MFGVGCLTHIHFGENLAVFSSKSPENRSKTPRNQHTLTKNLAIFRQSVFQNATQQAQSKIRKPLGFACESCFEPLAGVYASGGATLTIWRRSQVRIAEEREQQIKTRTTGQNESCRPEHYRHNTKHQRQNIRRYRQNTNKS